MPSQIFRKATDFLNSIRINTDWGGIGSVLLAFFLTRFMIIVITYFSMAQIPTATGDFWEYNPGNIIPNGLIRWDSAFYINIAQNGYDSKSAAFFPIYPLLIRFTSNLTGNSWTSGLWVSNTTFLIALFYLYALIKKEFDDNTARRAVFYIASAPAAFFFSAVYSESVFFLFIVACFYYSRNGNWFFAGIAGALASATRLIGILAPVFILFESFWQQGIRFFPKPWGLSAQTKIIRANINLLPKSWKGVLSSLFSTSGLLGYMIFLNFKFGDPMAFLHAEKSWNKSVSWDWLHRLLQTTFDMHKLTGNIFSGGIGSFEFLMDTFFTIVFIPLVIIVLFKFRSPYGVFTLLAYLFPLISGTTISMRRYVLILIPCYILLALWGKKPWVNWIVLGISLPLQTLFLILFSHWIFAG